MKCARSYPMAETLPGQNLDRHPGRLILPERHEMPLVVDRCERTRPINGCETIVVALAITQTDSTRQNGYPWANGLRDRRTRPRIRPEEEGRGALRQKNHDWSLAVRLR